MISVALTKPIRLANASENVKLQVLSGLEAENKKYVQNFSTSQGYNLMEEQLIHVFEYEVADSKENTGVVRKLDATSLSQMFQHCLQVKTNLDDNDPNYESKYFLHLIPRTL